MSTLQQRVQTLFDNYNNCNAKTPTEFVNYVFSLVPGSGGTITGNLAITGTLDVDGNVNIGEASSTNQRRLRIGQGTATIDIGTLFGSSSIPAIYMNTATPDASNYTLTKVGGGTILNDSSGTNTLSLFVGGTGGMQINGVKSSGVANNFLFNSPATTGATASTEITGFKVNGANRTWLTGNFATQRENRWIGPTWTTVGASTITNGFNSYSDVPTVNAPLVVTNLYAGGYGGNVKIENGGSLNIGLTNVPAAWIGITASTVSKAQINLTTGVAPTAPVDGDIWREDNTNTGLKIRVNGVTKTITLA